ncbi:MAG: hypothetical protein JW885_04730 [Deltaproteobacteria bacterium]|nr:hypothetical protein [Candidatus Zymogenaceae bacterium]
MAFNAPKKLTWWIAFVLLLVGGIFWILGLLGVVELPYSIDVWCLLVSAVLYALGTSLKGF